MSSNTGDCGKRRSGTDAEASGRPGSGLTRREWIGLVSMAGVALGTQIDAATPPPKRSNILILTADDLDASFLGCLGAPGSLTPNLDALATRSTVFAETHTSAPICQPSRSALMTGLYPQRNGAVGFNPINPGVQTLPAILRNAGYFTAAINKLSHMAPKESFPWEFAVEEIPGPGQEYLLNQSYTSRKMNARNPDEYPALIKEAIEQARAQGRPFFLNVNTTDPHRPFRGTQTDQVMHGSAVKPVPRTRDHVPGFLEPIPDVIEECGQYAESVTRADDCIGRVLKALDDSGEREQTIVVFLSDHGMPFPFAKTTLYRSGTRTPLIISGPNIAAGVIDRERLVSSVDIMPTLLEAVGVDAPAGLDGRSIRPLLRDPKAPGREYVYSQVQTIATRDAYPSRCLRSLEYSLIWNAWASPTAAFRNESMSGLTFKAMSVAGEKDPAIRQRVEFLLHRCPFEFYRIADDPWERSVQAENPLADPAASALAKRLLEELIRCGDPLAPTLRHALAAK